MHINQNLEVIDPNVPYLHNGVQHPKSIFRLWERREKAAIGVFEVEHESVPDGMRATGWLYAIVGDYATATPVLEPEQEQGVYVPQSVSRAQGKVALIMFSMWDSVLAYVDSIEDPTEKLLAETALYDTQEWRRDSPFLIECSAAMGMGPADLDELFLAAAEVEL